MKYLLLIILSLVTARSFAIGVTFENCPTLTPLPIVGFQPAAMVPINNVETAFDIGMNVTLKTALKTANLMRMQAINDSYSAIMKSYIKATTNAANKDVELEQQMFDLRRNALAQIETAKDKADSSIFPSDPVYTGRVEGRENVNDNTYQFLIGMCTMSKMVGESFDEESRKRANSTKGRRNLDVAEGLKQVQSTRNAAQQMVDMHYDLFCSEDELAAGVCATASIAPKMDLSAINVLYPVGYIDTNETFTSDYRTKYTYNQLESFAASQYVKNVVGVLPVPPPSTAELSKPGSQAFVGAFKQSQASLSIAADAIQYVSSLREPVNGAGVIISQLDAIAIQLDQARDTDLSISVQSSSDEGRALAIAQQMAFQNQLQYLLFRIEDYEKMLDASKLAIKVGVEAD
jgi:hypothetical protein